MPRAEAGSTKAISNKLKSRGLTRLRWYCQPCEKACRDENGFKCHVQSESHVRQMLLIGENSKGTIDKYSSEFQREFVELLRTTHGEKKVHVNHFYQQVISNKSHVHMNATKWTSLTQFAAHLGREGIVRCEETEKGLFISWVDNRPETLKKREAVMKKERQDKGDEEREQRLIQQQIERARKAEMAKAAAAVVDKAEGGSGEESEEKGILERKEGEKVKLSFGAKSASQSPPVDDEKPEEKPEAAVAKTSISFSSSTTKPKNIFATKPSAVKPSNAFASVKKSAFVPQQQKVSQQEMIMKREMEAMEAKKRKFVGNVVARGNVFDAGKKQRVS